VGLGAADIVPYIQVARERRRLLRSIMIRMMTIYLASTTARAIVVPRQLALRWEAPRLPQRLRSHQVVGMRIGKIFKLLHSISFGPSNTGFQSAMTPSALSEPLELPLSQGDLDAINAHLKLLTPEEILRWAVERIPGLYQTTAFGLTGLVAIDMLSKITKSPPTPIFLDTLYHFSETYELVDVVKARYDIPVIVYKPEGCATREAFELKYGERFWERDEAGYDYAVKVGKEMINVNDELTLVHYIIGRTRQACLL
jgi:hypothetical protein